MHTQGPGCAHSAVSCVVSQRALGRVTHRVAAPVVPCCYAVLRVLLPCRHTKAAPPFAIQKLYRDMDLMPRALCAVLQLPVPYHGALLRYITA